MKFLNFTISLLAFLFGLLSHAESSVDDFYQYIQNPKLLIERADDPHAAEVQALLQELAPEINFHPDEKFTSMDPMEFLGRSSLRQGGFVHSKLISGVGEFTPESLATLDESYFIKLEGAIRAAPTLKAPLLWELSATTLVDKMPRSQPNARWVMIDYWYTPAYNEALYLMKLGNHQGEWEGSGFLVELSLDAAGKLKHRLGGAYYAHHTGGFWFCKNELEWTGQAAGEGHPRIYSAHGSHASYAKVGQYPRRGGLLGHDHTAKGGFVMQGWQYMRPLLLEPYYGFKGGWGARGFMSDMSGPSIPSPAKSYPRDLNESSLEKTSELLQSRCGN